MVHSVAADDSNGGTSLRFFNGASHHGADIARWRWLR
ncbi:hypothetical protein NORO109296_20200 [Nocardiopsis rhodophaea]